MRGKLHSHPISRPQPHKIRRARPGGVRHNQILVLQLQPVSGTRQKLDHDGLLLQGLVSTHGPFEVIATVCSKCAEFFPSSVTAVQRSGRTRLPATPAFTIGSIASTIPSFSRGFSFLRSI